MIVLSLCISIFLSLLVGFYGQSTYQAKLLASTRENLEKKTELIGLNFFNELNGITRALNVISDTPPIQGIIRSTDNKGIDPVDNSSLSFWKSRLQVIFSAFLKTNRTFSQIRYIHLNGQELTRVDQKENKTSLVPEKSLQNKANEPYFYQWKQMNYPELYISDVTPNKENGRIEYPVYLTMRVMKRIDFDGKPFGVLVINLNYVAFIQKILLNLYDNHFLGNQDNISILNDAGDFFCLEKNIVSTSFDKSIDVETKQLETYAHKIKQLNKNSGFVFFKHKIIYFSKLHYDERVKSRYIYLINQCKIPSFFDLNDRVIQKIIFASLIFFLLSFVVIIWLVKKIFKPLSDLASAVIESNEKSLPLRFVYHLPDEVYVLKQAILDKEKKLLELSIYDTLTGALNRNQFIFKLNEAMKKTKGFLAVLFIDIDNFKHINDIWGHKTGDSILREVYQRLAKITKKTDCIGRIGGDEFVLLYTEFKNKAEIKRFTEKCQATLSPKFMIEHGRLNVFVSVGISIYPEHAKTPEALLKYADYSMYCVKTEGKSNFKIFTQILKHEFERKSKVEKALQSIIKNDTFNLYYQPQFFVKTGLLYGVEALFRWPEDNDLYPVSPQECITVAEESGLIIPMGYSILERAMISHMEFLKNIDNQNVHLSINLSAVQLREDDFLDKLKAIIQKTHFPVALLTLEVTEQKLLTNFRHEQSTLREIRAIGIDLALDDFGTGYASLRYIRELPFSILKIDKTLIDGLQKRDAKVSNIIKFTINFSKNLDLCIVAEGVENEDEVTFLKKHGCHIIQGYYFDKPLPLQTLIKKYGDNAQKR